jgi:hypothetical protein
MDIPQILYVNHMKNDQSNNGQENVHIMFNDGSMMRIQVEMDEASEGATQGAKALLQQILDVVDQIPKSEEEIAPICLGDTTCMYCNGKGCVNCRRK